MLRRDPPGILIRIDEEQFEGTDLSERSRNGTAGRVSRGLRTDSIRLQSFAATDRDGEGRHLSRSLLQWLLILTPARLGLENIAL
jgi:hypothetical protein